MTKEGGTLEPQAIENSHKVRGKVGPRAGLIYGLGGTVRQSSEAANPCMSTTAGAPSGPVLFRLTPWPPASRRTI